MIRKPAERVATALMLVVLLLCFARGLVIVRHEPMIGLANNYDMIRVQGCIDAFPLRPADVPAWSNSWQAPIERYSFRSDVDAGCFLTSEALFAFAALPLMRAETSGSGDGGFSMTWLGAVKFAALLLAVACVSLVLRAIGSPAGALLNAVVALAVLFDPAVTIYFNAMYAEFAALFFAYVSIALAVIALRRPSMTVLGALALAIVLACLSKIQHVGFGLVLLGTTVLTGLAWERIPRRLLAAVAFGAIVGTGLQMWHMGQPSNESIRHANLTNTVLLTVLGSTEPGEREAMTDKLGLPRHCAAHAGKTWFTEGLQAAHPCPELYELSRARIAAALLASPATLVRMTTEGLHKAQSWIPAFLGKVEHGVAAALPPEFFTLDRVLVGLPFALYLALFFLPCAIVLALVLARRRAGRSGPLLLAMTMCAAYELVSFASVVLGDGFADVVKQFHLGTTMLFAFWVLFAGWLALNLAQLRAHLRVPERNVLPHSLARPVFRHYGA